MPGFCVALLLCPFTAARAENQDVTNAADTLTYLLPGIGLASTLVVNGPDGGWVDREGLYQWTKTIVSTGATQLIWKPLAGKQRPVGGGSKSFPSGHVAGACSGGGFLSARYGGVWSVVGLGGCAFTAYARVQAEAHFRSDVVAGASLGLLYSWLFVTPRYDDVALMPMALDDGVGINLMVVDANGGGNPRRIHVEKPPNRFRYGFDFGPKFLISNEITSPANGGTTFNLNDLNKRDDPTTRAGVDFSFFSGHHTLAGAFFPFESRDDGTFSMPVNFAGVVFPADTLIESSWRSDYWSAEWQYDLSEAIDADSWLFRAGAALALNIVDIKLRTDDGTLQSSFNETFLVPLGILGIGYRISPRWSVNLDTRASLLPNRGAFTTGASVALKTSHNWDWQVGYRYDYQDIRTESLRNKAQYHSLYLQVGYSW
jgi:hypothetical protein